MADEQRKDVLVLVSNAAEGISSLNIATELKIDHQAAIGVIKSILATDDQCVSTAEVKTTKFECTSEGNEAVTKGGSPEALAFQLVPKEGIPKAEFDKNAAAAGLGPHAVGQCMKQKWLKMDKSGGAPVLQRLVDTIDDKVLTALKSVAQAEGGLEDKAANDSIGSKDCTALVKRKLLRKVVITSLHLTKGPNFTVDLVKAVTDLTPEMLQDGSWKTANFRKFNLDAEPRVPAGALHPLLKVKQEFRQIFLEMGFFEMPTNQYVESSFWNFDALFQPQQHPARDAHDTFFMSQPELSDKFPEEYLEKVQNVHENGGFGSIGYRYDWSRAEAQKNILRTHTTAVSTRMLYKLGQVKPFRPVKYFSIDRVFRNESLDATHLAEFHQVEGVVADYNLTLGHLIGVIAEFFERLGMSDVKFKPAYNPYTEPSMEIFAYHPDLKKEVEVGNSGIFRPEMLRPMGLPEDVTVIAWGLSVERPTMIKYGYNNIRSLFGPGVDLKLVRDNPMCQL